MRERTLKGWQIATLAVSFVLMGVGNYDEKLTQCRDVVLSVGATNEECPYAGQTVADAQYHPICRCSK